MANLSAWKMPPIGLKCLTAWHPSQFPVLQRVFLFHIDFQPIKSDGSKDPYVGNLHETNIDNGTRRLQEPVQNDNEINVISS